MTTLDEIKQIYYKREWKSEKNQKLLEIIGKDRLNIEPACLHGLDELGLNHLEIIELVGCIGKNMNSLPTATVDFLNFLQDKYGCVFNYDEKIKGKIRHKLNGYVANWVGEYWGRSSALRKLTGIWSGE